jgi:hypothetical protein
MRRSWILAALLSAATLAAGCHTPPPRVSLRTSGNVPDAAVTIDDQYIGSLKYVSKRGVALPPGKHRITVERAGYFPWDRLIEATEQPVVLDIQMVPVPD